MTNMTFTGKYRDRLIQFKLDVADGAYLGSFHPTSRTLNGRSQVAARHPSRSVRTNILDPVEVIAVGEIETDDRPVLWTNLDHTS